MVPLAILSHSETPISDGSGSNAALIAVAGLAMILATAGLIYVVVRRKPATPTEQAGSTAIEETDTAPAANPTGG
jgi:hypothetical protein